MTTIRAKALLFDMDGTIVDSTAVVERVWGELAANHGIDPAPLMAAVHGVRAADSIARFAPAGADREAMLAELLEIEVAAVDGVVAVPGAASLLADAAGLPWAVVTSADPELFRVRMAAAGLPLPEVVVTAADVDHGKPHPQGYLLAAERLGVEPGDALVFEDAPAGLAAAERAGMRAVAIGGATGDASPAVARVPDLEGSRLSAVDGILELRLAARP